ncbi:hypothetical protein KM043_017516 [Ampulex compressa]|uniref:Venom protein n=1 Tax=Ampulex compressa TaxID=860918 RepID=A0A1W6EVQ0_AMPCP|nr:venom protein [Ampulex compressa]KAG7189866.1 hypothetical protein KM043_017516 [Ampulex compressa]
MKSALLICTMAILCVVYADSDVSGLKLSDGTPAESFNYEAQKQSALNDITKSLNELSQLHHERVISLNAQLDSAYSLSFSTVQKILSATLADVSGKAGNSKFNTDVCYQVASNHITNLTTKSTEDLDICKTNAMQEIESFAEIISAVKTLGENLLVKLNSIPELCNTPTESEKSDCLSNEMQNFPLSSYTVLVDVTNGFQLPVVNGALNPNDGCFADVVLTARNGAANIQNEAENCAKTLMAKVSA